MGVHMAVLQTRLSGFTVVVGGERRSVVVSCSPAVRQRSPAGSFAWKGSPLHTHAPLPFFSGPSSKLPAGLRRPPILLRA